MLYTGIKSFHITSRLHDFDNCCPFILFILLLSFVCMCVSGGSICRDGPHSLDK